METTPNRTFNPEDFVELIGGFDTGNPSEAEAISAARLLRRMLVTHSLRLVDAMGRTDVMRALDAQFEPLREQPPELQDAREEIAELTEQARIREQIIDELQEERGSNRGTDVGSTTRKSVSGGGLVNEFVVAVASLAAIALLIASAFR